MITAAIVDDEVHSCNVLNLIVQNFCKDVTVVGMAEDFDQAVELIQEQRPDLVFLDIGLPKGSGLDLSLYCPEQTNVVYVTAHTHFAVEAFQTGALYYISKPVKIPEVIVAVEKCRKAMELGEVMASHNQAPLPPEEHLILPEPDGFRLIPLDSILYVEGFRSYCKLHLQDAKPMVISMLVKEVEAQLPFPRFIRTHRSYIVPRAQITKVGKGLRGGNVELRMGANIPVAREYAENIRRHLLGRVWE